MLEKTYDFFAVGLSYKNSDADTRGNFSLDDHRQHALFLDAKETNIKDLIIINTCNRTELYAWSQDAEILKDLLCKHSEGNKILFDQIE